MPNPIPAGDTACAPRRRDLRVAFAARLFPLALGIALGAPATAAEDYFQSALDYTVDIRTVINTPFIEDRRGTFGGAGFLVDAVRGWIMTNAHVVGRSPASVQISFRDQRFVPAEKHYIDPYLDLAILKVAAEAIPPRAREAQLDCDQAPPVGQPVAAFGHPWGLRFTGTRGIVSGFAVDGEVEWLQTDAPLNNGNSGGPLVSLRSGRVVGVNAAILDKAETENLNFAVPILYACRIVQLLREGRDPSPPVLPVVFVSHTVGNYELQVAASYEQPDNGLEVGDVLLRFDDSGTPIRNETELVHGLRGHRGERMVVVRRDGREQRVGFAVRPRPSLLARRGLSFSRLLIAPVPLRDQAELGAGVALMIHSAEGSDAACSSYLDPWQFLVTADNRTFSDIDALHAYLSSAQRNGQPVRLLLKSETSLPDRQWEYLACTLPVENPHIVGAIHAAGRSN